MKILLLHQYYLGPHAPGSSRFNAFSRIWTEEGHEVSVLADRYNYMDGTRQDRGHGIRTSRVRQTFVGALKIPQHNYYTRALSYAKYFVAVVPLILLGEKPDIVIATSPPLTIALAGIFASRRHSIPLVFEVRDLWPESAITTGVIQRDSMLAKSLFELENQAYYHASAICALTPAIALDIADRQPTNCDKVFCIPNGADFELYDNQPEPSPERKILGWGGRYVALYAGAHGRANDLSQLLETAHYLRRHEDILIACVGDGPQRMDLAARANREGLMNIRFYGAISKDRIAAVIQAADIGLSVLQHNPTFETVYPGKVFDYLAAAKPVVLGVDGAARQLFVDDAQAAVFVPPGNARQLCNAILRLRNAPDEAREMGARGQRWVRQHMNRKYQAAQYLQHLQNISRQHQQLHP